MIAVVIIAVTLTDPNRGFERYRLISTTIRAIPLVIRLDTSSGVEKRYMKASRQRLSPRDSSCALFSIDTVRANEGPTVRLARF